MRSLTIIVIRGEEDDDDDDDGLAPTVVEPDGDTLSFLMEALATDAENRRIDPDRDSVSPYLNDDEAGGSSGGGGGGDSSALGGWDGDMGDRHLVAADEVMALTDALEEEDRDREEEGTNARPASSERRRRRRPAITRTARRRVLYQFLRLLSSLGEVDAALRSLREAAHSDEGVIPDSFLTVAMAFADRGDFVTAKEVILNLPGEAGYGDLPYFMKAAILNEET